MHTQKLTVKNKTLSYKYKRKGGTSQETSVLSKPVLTHALSGWQISFRRAGLCHVLFLPPFCQPGASHASSQRQEAWIWPVALP